MTKGHRRFPGPEGGSASPASLQAQAAARNIPRDVETEFDVLQFLEGCKGAFVAGAWQPAWTGTCFHAVKRSLWPVTQAGCSAWVPLSSLRTDCATPALTLLLACPAVHESMHGTRDLAPMVSLPVLRTFA